MSDVHGALAGLEPHRQGQGQCRTCRAIKKEPELADSILGAYQSGVTAAQISRVLQSHGYAIGVRALQYHLKNGHQTL